MKTNKYTYYKVLQMYIIGYGFDDCEFLETKSNYILNREQRKELKNLRENYRYFFGVFVEIYNFFIVCLVSHNLCLFVLCKGNSILFSNLDLFYFLI